MTAAQLQALSPYMVLSGAAVVVLLVAAFCRNHALVAALTAAGLVAAFLTTIQAADVAPQQVTRLAIVDSYAMFFTALICLASLAVTLLAYGYLEARPERPEEFYVLLLLATLGSTVLAASSHFASFFLGLEILSVSLYAMIAYQRDDPLGIEAGVKYLVLAATSAAFLLFGMALIYAATGTMDLAGIAHRSVRGDLPALWPAGLVLVLVGVGFKLAVVPFHLWTPDVYQGAPAPTTAFVATVSKGAMFALLLRYFQQLELQPADPVLLVLAIVAVLSMFGGNLLALLQDNVKRILAYSSIAHLGYLLVAFLAGGQQAVIAVGYYLVAYFVTTLGAFGVVTVLSGSRRDADAMDDYRGLAWRRPWPAAVLTAMLLSLAGIPLSAGFVGKFYVLAAGVGSRLWLLVVILVINSAIGLYYYLRVIVAIYSSPAEQTPAATSSPIGSVAGWPLAGHAALLALSVALVWLGVYPSPLLEVLQAMARAVAAPA